MKVVLRRMCCYKAFGHVLEYFVCAFFLRLSSPRATKALGMPQLGFAILALATSSDLEHVQISDPRNAGAGDQGPWSTCAVFALLGALRLEQMPEIQLGSVQDMGEARITHNHLNSQDRPILQHGVTIEHLVGSLNEKMMGREPSLIFRTKCEASLKFRIAYQRYDAIEGLCGAPRSDPCCYWNEHGHHAMQIRSCEENTVVTENSWGSEHRQLTIPGDMYAFSCGFRVTLSDIMVTRPHQTDWISLQLWPSSAIASQHAPHRCPNCNGILVWPDGRAAIPRAEKNISSGVLPPLQWCQCVERCKLR